MKSARPTGVAAAYARSISSWLRRSSTVLVVVGRKAEHEAVPRHAVVTKDARLAAEAAEVERRRRQAAEGCNLIFIPSRIMAASASVACSNAAER